MKRASFPQCVNYALVCKQLSSAVFTCALNPAKKLARVGSAVTTGMSGPLSRYLSSSRRLDHRYLSSSRRLDHTGLPHMECLHYKRVHNLSISSEVAQHYLCLIPLVETRHKAILKGQRNKKPLLDGKSCNGTLC